MAKLGAAPDGILEKLIAADTAIHNGDAKPRKKLWSHGNPVTLFGAAVTKSGWKDIGQTFDWLASRFSKCSAFDNEVVASGSSGDLAYIVGIEHTTASVGGAPPAPYSLRVTTILRREAGEWRVIHRHGDPYDEASREPISRL